MKVDNRRADDVRLGNIERLLDKIFSILNGPKGVITTQTLQGQQIKAIPSPTNLRWYAFVGGGVVTFFGLIGYGVVHLFRGP